MEIHATNKKPSALFLNYKCFCIKYTPSVIIQLWFVQPWIRILKWALISQQNIAGKANYLNQKSIFIRCS